MRHRVTRLEMGLRRRQTRVAYHSTKDSEISKRGQMVRKFPGKKNSENPKMVEFQKSDPFKRKFRKFRENQMQRKFPGKNVQAFGYTSQG